MRLVTCLQWLLLQMVKLRSSRFHVEEGKYMATERAKACGWW